jgi:AcrR family transcriptional regulator
MKKVTTTDLRTIRTKKAIHQAFQEMAGAIGIKNITVKELAQLAGINRKTFYSHYDSIDALQTELVKVLIKEIAKIIQKEQPHEFSDTLREIYCYLCNLPLWCRDLMYASNNSLERLFFEELMDEPLSQYEKWNDLTQMKQYMKLRYIAAASMELFRVWHESNGAIPIEEFAATATNLICCGVQDSD